ncbi:ABC-2 type transporter [compost metagenome]
MTLLRFYSAEILLHFHRQRRYAFELVVSSLVLLAVFAGLAYGMAWLPSTDLLPKQSSLALGFVVWSFASASYSGVAGEAADEVRRRTLEQLCVVGRPLAVILLVRSSVQIAGALTGTLVLLHVTFWIVGLPLDVPVLPLITILLVSAPSLLGLGLIMGGLSVLFKQAEAVNALMLLGVVALVGLPTYPGNMLALLPFSHAAAWIIAEQDGLLLKGEGPRLLFIVGNAAVYLAVGLAVFNACYRAARRRGTLGHN